MASFLTMMTQNTTTDKSELPFIPLAVPHLGGNEWKYVKECLDTSWVSSAGLYVDRFEAKVADYTKAGYGVAVVSGTAALHIALMTAGVRQDDEVLVPTLTFIAPVNAVSYCGAHPVFIDSESQTLNMDISKLADFLENECHVRGGELVNKSTGRTVRAVLPVHLFGHPTDMDILYQTAQRYGLRVVEDASQSIGGRYKNLMIGERGDITCFSFNGNKIVTTGGGGVIVTNNEAASTRARYLTTQAKDDPFEYIDHSIGFNYRLPNINAALGLAQMEQLDGFIKRKRAIWEKYAAKLTDIPGLRIINEAAWAFSTYWTTNVLIDEKGFGTTARILALALNEQRIQARLFWQPIHLQKPYKNSQAYKVQIAENLYKCGLSLPSSVGITDEEIDRVVSAVRNKQGNGKCV